MVTERTPTYQRTPLPAPRRALEIGVETAYTQPFGDMGNERAIGSVVDQGIGFGAELNYRINPRWAIGLDGVYHRSMADESIRDNTDIHGGAFGVHATVHMNPYERIDPYFTFGSGYRLLHEDRDGAGQRGQLTHGFQLGKAKLGIDVRITRSVAVGPFIGADVNRFFWANPEGETGNLEVNNKEWSTFLSAGLAGRFDLGGSRVHARERVAIAPVRTYFITETFPVPRMTEPPRDTEVTVSTERQSTQLFIDANILSACGISSPKAYFDFDSAAVQGGDQETLDRVAQCMTDGALKGRSISVVGHTDPRGSEEYNDQLGQSRAESVAGYLSSKGVSRPKISTQSRGEQEASGTEPQGWSYDRRVDIRLAD